MFAIIIVTYRHNRHNRHTTKQTERAALLAPDGQLASQRATRVGELATRLAAPKKQPGRNRPNNTTADQIQLLRGAHSTRRQTSTPVLARESRRIVAAIAIVATSVPVATLLAKLRELHKPGRRGELAGDSATVASCATTVAGALLFLARALAATCYNLCAASRLH